MYLEEFYPEINHALALLLNLIIISIFSYVFFLVTKKIILRIISKLVKKTKTTWDDVFFENRVFSNLAGLSPALIFFVFAHTFAEFKEVVVRFAVAYMSFVILKVLLASLESINQIYETYEVSKSKPIKGYIQTIKIVLVLFSFIIIIATLMGKSPLVLLSGIGAMTAILMLVFKDSILSLVASVQLTSGNLIQKGDWISIPQFNADGDVIDIALHTIKVQNFDKTIVVIPTYKLMSEPFVNWRGMSESGGRRISRSINIDLNTIKFADSELISKLQKIVILKEYLAKSKEDIKKHNSSLGEDGKLPYNGRELTNVGLFRLYIEYYLKNNDKIFKPGNEKGMTFLVRQLAPTEKGLPLQIYVFTTDNVWVNYEKIQADIFDHLLAVIDYFDLKVYQLPAGKDFKEITKINN